MLSVPDELDLLVFFESEPIKSRPEDGYFCYRYVDNNIELYFSFDVAEGSIQARLNYLTNDIAIVSGELATKISIESDRSGEYVACLFESNQTRSKAVIRLKPTVSLISVSYTHLTLPTKA